MQTACIEIQCRSQSAQMHMISIRRNFSDFGPDQGPMKFFTAFLYIYVYIPIKNNIINRLAPTNCIIFRNLISGVTY